MKKPAKLILLFMAGVCLYFAYKAFWPQSYNTKKLQDRPSTEYWNLPSGSRIGYTLLKGRNDVKKPYPLVYLHGGPGAGITDREIQTYRSIAEEGYDVYLYDQVGCGHSSRPADISEYTAERHLLDLEQIIKKINKDKIVLVGQSWGSILAVSFLAKHPSLVHKLVITAPAPLQPARKDLESIPPPDSLELRPATFNARPREKVSTLRSKLVYYLARKYNLKLASDIEADQFATFFTSELNKSMVCDTQNAVIAEGTEGLYVHYVTSKSLANMKDGRAKLRQLDTPVLLLKAQCDNQLWGYTTEYLEVFRNVEFAYIRNAGHNIFLEQPHAYISTILAFLENTATRDQSLVRKKIREP